MLRFAGFELDRQRAELRGPDREAIKLRPKTLNMLILFAANAGRVLSKQELMESVWPNIHVGDDSLFQCIRELRTALGDDQRQMVKLVSGRGYVFEADVSAQAPVEPVVAFPEAKAAAAPSTFPSTTPSRLPWAPSRWFGLRRPVAFALMGLGAIAGLVLVTTVVAPRFILGRGPIAIAVMPIAADSERDMTAMAAEVTTRLIDGLAKIDNIRVTATQTAPQDSRILQPDFVVSGELQKSERSWEVRARMTRTATGEVVWSVPVSVAVNTEVSLQQSRIAAGIGHPLALRINALLNADPRPATTDSGSSPGNAKVVIEQATASITQTTPERFAASQTMLERALAADPDNVDLAVALAALQLRGVQMVWYNPAGSVAAEASARSVLERALRSKPTSIPVLETYCRFLNTTNQFVESLVACARALNFDPWNGIALYHIGLAQMQLGRFEDALATFKQADRFDTPRVSRWTWQLGAGMTYLLMGRSEDALPWLQSSIAITPATGRTYMLLSAAYQQLGRTTEAKAAMERALALRPGANLGNIALPPQNASPVFLAAAEWIGQAYLAAGLPER